MKENSMRKNVHKVLLSVLLIFSVGIMGVGTAYGRYQQKVNADLNFVAKDAASFEVSSEEDWVIMEDGAKRITITVGNQEDENDSYFQVRILATSGLEQEDAVLSLIEFKSNGMERKYAAELEAFAEDSVYHQEIGRGFICRFFDEDGKELCWKLEGGMLSEQEIVLELSGEPDASLLEIVVTEIPAN